MDVAGGYGPRLNTPKEMELLHCQPEESELEATHRREKAATMMTRGMCHGASQLFHYYHQITDFKLKRLVGDFNAFNNLDHVCSTFIAQCKVRVTCCLATHLACCRPSSRKRKTWRLPRGSDSGLSPRRSLRLT